MFNKKLLSGISYLNDIVSILGFCLWVYTGLNGDGLGLLVSGTFLVLVYCDFLCRKTINIESYEEDYNTAGFIIYAIWVILFLVLYYGIALGPLFAAGLAIKLRRTLASYESEIED